LGVFIKQLPQLGNRKGLLLTNIHTRIDIVKQAGDVRSTTRFHSPVVDTAKHTHIRGNGVGLQPTFIKILSVTS
jgi:hypothetical protein